MPTTPRPVLDAVVRSVCGRRVERLVPLAGGGLHETYRVEVRDDEPVVVRIARRPVPWFTDEEHVIAQARAVVAALPGRPVWAIDADAIVVRPGPRIVDGVEAIAAILHPDAVPAPPPGVIARVA